MPKMIRLTDEEIERIADDTKETLNFCLYDSPVIGETDSTAYVCISILRKLNKTIDKDDLKTLAENERGDSTFVVVDSKVKAGEQTPILGRFSTEAEASEFISTLPEHETGRYGLDPSPSLGTHVDSGESVYRDAQGNWHRTDGTFVPAADVEPVT